MGWAAVAKGRLDHVADANGNRITLAYSFGRLISLTHSNGAQILLQYTHDDVGPAELLRVVERFGDGSADRVTAFEYDYSAGGPHLSRVIAPGNRVTQYSYAPLTTVSFTTMGPLRNASLTLSAPDPRSHALQSVTYADGSRDDFAYDDRGRLVTVQKDGAAERVTFGYVSPGGVVVTDATGRPTTLKFGLGGQLAQVRDADGRIAAFGFDSRFELTDLTGPGGERYRYSYDTRGNLTGIRDALNLQTTFAYQTNFNRLASFTDARGSGIDYQYDSRGNLTAIVYVDGSQQSFTYDAVGNVLSSTNRRGQTVTYSYNAAGQVTSKNYDTTPGVTDFVYHYDAAGNLIQAIDANGSIQMTYAPNTDWLTRIEYPSGQFFAFQYDTVGRRTQRADQDGNMVNYQYDAAGRLDRMTDGADVLIVDYDDDAAGRLSLKTLGNGYLTPNDVLQVINYINRGGTEEKPSGEGAEGEPGGDRGRSGKFGWLAMVDTAGSSATPALLPPPPATGPQSDLRVDWLTAAVDDLAYRTTYLQQDVFLELKTRDADNSNLPDWEALLDDPAIDLADLDAYFAAMSLAPFEK